MARNLAFARQIDSLDVLIVDENHGMQAILATLLKSGGISRIRTVRNANRAMEEMVRRPPDLMIAQWTVHTGETETLLRTLRREAMRPLAFMPVIALCAQVSRGLIMQAVDAGVSTVVRTPVSPKTLIDRVRWFTEDARPFVLEDGRYVLQGTADGPAHLRPDPGHGLMDFHSVAATGIAEL